MTEICDKCDRRFKKSCPDYNDTGGYIGGETISCDKFYCKECGSGDNKGHLTRRIVVDENYFWCAKCGVMLHRRDFMGLNIGEFHQIW